MQSFIKIEVTGSPREGVQNLGYIKSDEPSAALSAHTDGQRYRQFVQKKNAPLTVGLTQVETLENNQRDFL